MEPLGENNKKSKNPNRRYFRYQFSQNLLKKKKIEFEMIECKEKRKENFRKAWNEEKAEDRWRIAVCLVIVFFLLLLLLIYLFIHLNYMISSGVGVANFV
jgi:hypothetical protein